MERLYEAFINFPMFHSADWKPDLKALRITLWCLIEGGGGVGISGGGLEISLKLNKQGRWNKRGGGGWKISSFFKYLKQ